MVKIILAAIQVNICGILISKDNYISKCLWYAYNFISVKCVFFPEASGLKYWIKYFASLSYVFETLVHQPNIFVTF